TAINATVPAQSATSEKSSPQNPPTTAKASISVSERSSSSNVWGRRVPVIVARATARTSVLTAQYAAVAARTAKMNVHSAEPHTSANVNAAASDAKPIDAEFTTTFDQDLARR